MDIQLRLKSIPKSLFVIKTTQQTLPTIPCQSSLILYTLSYLQQSNIYFYLNNTFIRSGICELILLKNPSFEGFLLFTHTNNSKKKKQVHNSCCYSQPLRSCFHPTKGNNRRYNSSSKHRETKNNIEQFHNSIVNGDPIGSYIPEGITNTF